MLIHRGATTLLLSDRGVELLRDGRRRLLDRRTGTYWIPGVSHDGHYAAWEVNALRTATGARLVVHDLVHDEQLAAVPWATTTGWVPGIDDHGRVYFEELGGDVSYFEAASGEVVRVRGVPGRTTADSRVGFVTADGFGVQTGGAAGTTVVGVVSADGRFTQQRMVTHGWRGYSPSGDRFVHDTVEGFAVDSTSSEAEPVPLELPAPGRATWRPVWESDDALLLAFDPVARSRASEGPDGLRDPARRPYLLRRDSTTGDCEVALEPGRDQNGEPVYRSPVARTGSGREQQGPQESGRRLRDAVGLEMRHRADPVSGLTAGRRTSCARRTASAAPSRCRGPGPR